MMSPDDTLEVSEVCNEEIVFGLSETTDEEGVTTLLFSVDFVDEGSFSFNDIELDESDLPFFEGVVESLKRLEEK